MSSNNPLEEQVDELFDNLIKSRFIEMFGSIRSNEKGWEKVNLKDLCNSIVDGSHAPSKGGNESKFLMLSSKNIVDDKITVDEPRYLSEEDFIKEDRRTNVSSGDILMTIVGTIGRTAIVPDNSIKMTFQRSVAVIHPNFSKVTSVFLKYALDTIQPEIDREAHGSSQKGIYLNQVEKIGLFRPPLELQEQFGSFIQQVDKSKFIMKQLVSKYDQLVKSRFIEMFDKCEKVSLTDLADVVMGQSPDSSSYNDDGKGMPFFQGKTEFGDTFVTVNKYCTAPKKVAKPMDILMSVRAPVGSVNLTEFECCIGRGLAAITPKKTTDVWFLFNALRTMEKQISDMGVGSTFTAISKDDMKKIKIPRAPLDLQKEFSAFVQQVDKSKFEIIKTIERLFS